MSPHEVRSWTMREVLEADAMLDAFEAAEKQES